MNNLLPTEYQSFIHLSRYELLEPELGRRETWDETVSRYFNFFEEQLETQCDYELTVEERNELEQAVLGLGIMPSMRCLMTR